MAIETSDNIDIMIRGTGTIDFKDAVIKGARLMFKEATNTIVKNLTIEEAYSDGVFWDDCTNCNLENVTIKGFKDEAIDVWENAKGEHSLVNVTVQQVEGFNTAHNYGCLIAPSQQGKVSMIDCNFDGMSARLPSITNCIVSMLRCRIAFDNYATEIRGNEAFLNLDSCQYISLPNPDGIIREYRKPIGFWDVTDNRARLHVKATTWTVADGISFDIGNESVLGLTMDPANLGDTSDNDWRDVPWFDQSVLSSTPIE